LSVATDAPTRSSTLSVEALGPNGDARGAASVAVEVLGRSGALDTSFGTNGVVSFASNQPLFAAIRRRDDGRFVIGGSSSSSPNVQTCFLMQITADGQPDEAFAQGPTFADGCRMYGMGITGDGRARALVAFPGDAAFAIAQLRGFTAGGAPDPSFGASGQSAFTVDDQLPNVLWTQADGRSLASGSVMGPGPSLPTSTGVVARYDASGNLDATFGSGGTVTSPFGPIVYGVFEQPDGKILAVNGGNKADELDVARLDTSGALDATYGTAGHTTVTFKDVLPLMAMEADGKLVVASLRDPERPLGWLLYRFDTTGQLEPSPDGGAAAITQMESYNTLYASPTGSIYAVGTRFDLGLLAIVRLGPTLELDPGFGDGGVLMGPAATRAYGFLVQPDGKMVVLGANDTTWFVERLWP
jgi:uncharacterized delta-60 repeat protein